MPFLSPDERRKVEETAKAQARERQTLTDKLAEVFMLVNGDGTFCPEPPWPFALSKDDTDFLKTIHVRVT